MAFALSKLLHTPVNYFWISCQISVDFELGMNRLRICELIRDQQGQLCLIKEIEKPCQVYYHDNLHVQSYQQP